MRPLPADRPVDPDSAGGTGDDGGISARAESVKRSGWGSAAARIGLGSRAVIYGMLAIVVGQLAAGAGRDTGADIDQGSSLQVLGRSAPGTLVLWLLAVAVLCYAAWRGSEAWLGTSDPGGDEWRPRVQAAIEGVAYLPFGWIAVSVAVGDDRNARQGRHEMSLSASVMGNVAGQVVVGVVGAVVVVVGGTFVWQGVRRTFRDHFDEQQMPAWGRRLTMISGAVGSVARGLVVVLAGVLVVYAAATANPHKAGGIDSALDELAGQPYGRWLLGAAAAGFGCFAVFALCEAAWRRVE